jgi:hypothetical protein
MTTKRDDAMRRARKQAEQNMEGWGHRIPFTHGEVCALYAAVMATAYAPDPEKDAAAFSDLTSATLKLISVGSDGR